MIAHSSTYDQGQSGENSAANHLRLRGYRILERNYRVHSGEIDIIARRGATLVFVEVKMRRSRRRGSPLEAVHVRKIQRISCAAATYVQAMRPKGVKTYRFDVMGVGPERNLLGMLKVEHLENAFETSLDFNV